MKTVVAPASVAKVAYTTTDHLGSPRVITDAIGQVVSRRDFMPFGEDLNVGVGNRTGDTGLKYSMPGDNVRQKFTGYQKDNETQLDFAEARMYENRYGRFTAVDPLLASGKSADPQTFNRYVYVANRPNAATDPSGQVPEWVYDKNAPVGTNRPVWVSSDEFAKGGYTEWEKTTYSTKQGEVTLDRSGPFSVEGVGEYYGWSKNGLTQGTGVYENLTSPLFAPNSSPILQRVSDEYYARASNENDLTRKFGLYITAFCVGVTVQRGEVDSRGQKILQAGVNNRPLPVLSPHFAPNPTKILQNITNKVSADLAASPTLARTVLSDAEFAAGQASPAIGRIQYGNGMERLAARHISSNSLDQQLFRYVGGPRQPDFIGRGLANGLNFDITTVRGVSSHLARPGYGRGLQVCTYQRPWDFSVF